MLGRQVAIDPCLFPRRDRGGATQGSGFTWEGLNSKLVTRHAKQMRVTHAEGDLKNRRSDLVGYDNSNFKRQPHCGGRHDVRDHKDADRTCRAS